MNNKPITARVKSGMFKTKEPLLNVGPAGVDGNNKTRTTPSPSKMKGYAMKSSPFKQTNQPTYRTDADGNLQVVLKSQETTPGTSGSSGSPGQAGQDAIYDTGKSLRGLSQEQLDWRAKEIERLGGIDNYHIEHGNKTKGKKVKDAIPAIDPTPAVDGTPEVTENYEQVADPMRKVMGEASTAYESRNNLRKGVQSNRKVKKYEIKNARSKKKGGGYYKNVLDENNKATGERKFVTDRMNESSKEIKKEARIAKRDQAKKDRAARKSDPTLSAKDQRQARKKIFNEAKQDAKTTKRDNKKDFKREKTEAKAKQTERNYQIAKQEAAGALEQATQRKTGTSLDQSIRTKDVRKTVADLNTDKQVAQTGTKKLVDPTENETTSTNKMKSSGFFKKKSPMKMNYFKK